MLQRPGYLYRFENDDHNSLMERPYTYGSGRDASGRMLMHSPPPLATLPAGTPVMITRVTRETGFDGPYKAIMARGVARVSEGEFDFTYVWGLGNAIDEAPWESAEYAPPVREREIACGAG